MNRILVIVAIAGYLTACGNGNESTAVSDSTSNINGTVPSTADTSVMGRRMGDTTGIMGDSTK